MTVGPPFVPAPTDRLRQVEHDRNREDVILARKLDQMFPGKRLHVGRVDHRHLLRGQTFGCYKMECFERIVRSILTVFVIGNQTSEKIGGQHLGRQEVVATETGLP